jgi:hypothetical protein
VHQLKVTVEDEAGNVTERIWSVKRGEGNIEQMNK